MDSIDVLIDQLADKLTAQAVVNAEKEPERFKKQLEDFPNTITDYRNRQILVLRDTFTSFKDKETLYKKYRNGAFHPSNKNTRHMFHLATGIKLASTVKETNSQLRNYIGEDYCLEQERLKAEAERTAQEAKEKQKQVEQEKLASSIKDKITKNEEISGNELVTIAYHYEIEMHPRTVGMIYKRVWLIKDGSARITKGGSVQSAFGVYNQVKAMILGNGVDIEAASGDNGNEDVTNHLFMRGTSHV